jgi:hypothetical protein
MTGNYTSRSEKYKQEYLAWMSRLEFFKQENAFFKIRLSEAVDNGIGKDALALAEHFQNQFIIKDDFIGELQHDTNAMLSGINKNNETEITKQDAKQNKLRNEINYLEKSFSQLKNEFNSFLLSVS